MNYNSDRKNERNQGIPCRRLYTDYLQSKNGEFAKWTNVTYHGLFGLDAKAMKAIWKNQQGNPNIARNHIPSAVGLRAVAYCECLVVALDLDNLWESHQEAIRLTKKKFRLYEQDPAA